MDLLRDYEFVAPIGTDPETSFRARRHATQRDVFLHRLRDDASEVRRLIVKYIETIGPRKNRILDMFREQGHHYLVTEVLADFTDLRSWLEAELRPAQTAEPGEFTRLAQAVREAAPPPKAGVAPGDFSSVLRAAQVGASEPFPMPLPGAPSPAAWEPQPALAPAEPRPGAEFEAIFGSNLGSSPAPAAAVPGAPGDELARFLAAPAIAPSADAAQFAPELRATPLATAPAAAASAATAAPMAAAAASAVPGVPASALPNVPAPAAVALPQVSAPPATVPTALPLIPIAFIASGVVLGVVAVVVLLVAH